MKTAQTRAVGWAPHAKKRFEDVRLWREKTLGISADTWLDIRFELACQFAETLAPNYHRLIRKPRYMDAFHYQFLKHDLELYDRQVIGDYFALKSEMLRLQSVEQFILSYLNNKA
jgi:rhamnogalacturonyl hydrolase YesR